MHNFQEIKGQSVNNWLITSGCSFSDNVSNRWPHFLADELESNLVNYGYGSSGNDYICHSAIFAINNLLIKKVKEDNIKVVVMWSGIDRHGHFVSRNETPDFDTLINPGHINPVNFLHMSEEFPDSGRFIPSSRKIEAGWLLGSPNCKWENNNIQKYKELHCKKFYTYEGLLFSSLNYFLQLQWFCENRGISLINLTFREIFPDINKFQTAKHLYEMIDFTKWIFWNKTKGLYEYTKDNDLEFYDDNIHPSPESHKNYVENFLIKNVGA